MPEDATTANLRLVDLMLIIRRRWRIVLGAVVVLFGLALGLSLSQAEQYQETSRILVRTPAAESNVVAGSSSELGFFPERELQNVIQVVDSLGLRAEVASAYDGPVDVDDVVATAAADGSDSIDISVVATESADAAELVNLYANTYITYSERIRIDTLLAGIAAINEQVAALDLRRADVMAPLEALQAELRDDPENGALASEVGLLASQTKLQTDAIDTQRGVFLQSLQNLTLAQDLTQTLSAQVIDEADGTSAPIAPKPIRDGVIGFMFGLLLGIGLALAREFLDDSIRSVGDLDAVTGGLVPTLAAVPTHGRADSIAIIDEPASVPAEAYRTLRTAVKFLGLERGLQVIQVTSPSTGDGKSTTSANLAGALVQAGHRVVVVSCDLRRPRLHTLFGIPGTPGFSDVVVGECSLGAALRTTESGVHVLAAGSRPPNPSELLSSARSEAVIDFLAKEFDYVILDSPPVLPVTDAVVLSRLAHGTIVVVGARQSPRGRVRHALTQLDQAGATVIGLVLNKATSGGREGYDYLYTEAPEPDRKLSGIGKR